VDFTGDVGPLAFDVALQVFGQLRQALPRHREFVGRLLPLAFDAVVLQRALHHHGQAVEAVLVDVIADTTHHRVGHHRLANGT